MMSARKRLGFFTRLLDDATPAERYRLAIEQIVAAENAGFDAAWVAQHHFNHDEGGLPSPFVFLAAAAARTENIRLGTGIVTLPLDNPLRVAEDATVFDLLSGGRLELGLGSGGTPSSFIAFGHDSADRGRIHGEHLARLRTALSGEDVGGGNRLYPDGRNILGRIWQATFSVDGGRRAGEAGDGLMLSRTQPRPKDNPHASLAEIQLPVIEAYLAALPSGIEPRILASRTAFVADKRARALELAETGLRRIAERFAAAGHVRTGDTLQDLVRDFDTHVGEPADVAASLAADPVLDIATEISFQVHSVDPPHELILRSIELIGAEVAPALGWRDRPEAAPRLTLAQ